MATRWARVQYKGDVSYCKVEDNNYITLYIGDLFSDNFSPTDQKIALNDEVKLLSPCKPTKMIALWNNYKALADEKGLSYPDNPLYIFKSPSSYAGPNDHIYHPRSYSGDVFFEGELGIVIGSISKDLQNTDDAIKSIFGYTCINDVTAFGLLKNDPNFDQWTRSKGFDSFGVFGPYIASDIDPKSLKVKTIVNDSEIKQDYPVNDMIFAAEEIVMYLSQNMTLFPGDIICVGTSIGLGPMDKDSKVTISIDGIGELENTYG